ncbi:MAG: hypothetical protein ACRDAM_13730, partial [Casimicrobium sp.]
MAADVDAATAAPPPPPASAPLYQLGSDALVRLAAASPSAAAQAALAERCKRLLAANTPIAQMPPECKPYLPPAPSPSAGNLFLYAPSYVFKPSLVGAATPSAPSPSTGAQLPTNPANLWKACNDRLQRGTPFAQLPTACQNILRNPPAGVGVALCPDPTVFTYVRMIPCPATAPSPPSTQRNPTQPPSTQRVPTVPPPAPIAPPAPPAQPPVAQPP